MRLGQDIVNLFSKTSELRPPPMNGHLDLDLKVAAIRGSTVFIILINNTQSMQRKLDKNRCLTPWNINSNANQTNAVTKMKRHEQAVKAIVKFKAER